MGICCFRRKIDPDYIEIQTAKLCNIYISPPSIKYIIINKKYPSRYPLYSIPENIEITY